MATRFPFLTAQWRNLVLLNFEADPKALQRHVPRGTELDFYGEKTFLSIVGFSFLQTRVLGLPIPGHRDFGEVNLRMYVRRRVEGTWRRGVVFIKEIVPRRLVAWVARVLYNENYLALPMRSQIEPRELAELPPARVEYAWKWRDRRHRLGARPDGSAELPAPDSLEEFIIEHYWGYSVQRDGGCKQYEVGHPPWRLAAVRDVVWDCDVAALYGPDLALFLEGPPDSAFLALGSPVTVGWGRRI